MRISLTIFGCLFIPLFGITQVFSVDTTYKPIVKTTASITPPHEHFQLFNHTGDSLNMRWRIDPADTYYPSQWSIAIQDNITYHNPAPDSSDFILPPIAGTMDKIIINIFHNAYPGFGEVHIDLFTTDYPADTIRIIFDIRIMQALGTDESYLVMLKTWPNPSAGNFEVSFPSLLDAEAEYSIIGVDGRQVVRGVILPGIQSQDFNLTGLAKGSYYLKINTKDVVYQSVCLVVE